MDKPRKPLQVETEYSLKSEVEAASRADSRRRLVGWAIAGAILVISISVTALVLPRSQTETAFKENTAAPAVAGASTSAQGKVEQATATPAPTSSSTVQASKPSTVSGGRASTSYSPGPIPFDRSAFMADGNKVMANYSHIVELVTFTASMTEAEKTTRIKDAVALDSLNLSQVTSLRGNLVSAEINEGKYLDATNLAESGVSKISVGLTFMNYWANDHSRLSDLQSGLGGVGEGSAILIEFNSRLSSL